VKRKEPGRLPCEKSKRAYDKFHEEVGRRAGIKKGKGRKGKKVGKKRTSRAKTNRVGGRYDAKLHEK